LLFQAACERCFSVCEFN